MREVAQRFAENLIRVRREKGMSQEELAFRASLHRTQIGMLESGVRVPRISTLVKLAGALDTTPNDLLEGIAWTPAGTTEGRYVEVAVPGLGIVSRRFQIERRS